MDDRQQARAAEDRRVRAAALALAQSRAAAAPAVAVPHEPVRLVPVSSYEWARFVDGGAPWASRAWDPRVWR